MFWKIIATLLSHLDHKSIKNHWTVHPYSFFSSSFWYWILSYSNTSMFCARNGRFIQYSDPRFKYAPGNFLPFRTFPQKKLRWIIIPTLISHSIVNHWPFWPIFWYVTNIFCLILMFYIFYYDLRCSMHQVEVEVEIKSPEKSLRIKSEMPSLFTITRILQNNSCLSSMIMHDHIHAKVLIIFVSSSS